MKHDFWHGRWAEGRIGFHQQDYHQALPEYWHQLGLTPGAQIFVPLCGKSHDMHWLAEQGYQVLGNELSEQACGDFFAEAGLEPELGQDAAFSCYQSGALKLLCGDFFALEATQLAGVSAVYDRAALIALPPEMRRDYAAKLCDALPEGVEVLLVTLEFEGEQGPPFSVAQAEVEQLFAARFRVEPLAEIELTDPRDKGRVERVYRLSDRA